MYADNGGRRMADLAQSKAGCMSALLPIIKERIAAQGSLSVAEYMALCMSHKDHGYYPTRDPLGLSGDFVTSPEISQIFGEMIGIWVAETWRQMGSPPLRLVELGPGRGTLMRDALRATAKQAGFHESMTVHMIEISPVLANAQYHALRHSHPRIEWLDTIDKVPEGFTIIVSNEFFDTLPIKQFVMTPEGLRERRIHVDEHGHLALMLGPAGLSLSKSSDATIANGTILEQNAAARSIMRHIAERIATYGGAKLAIDYGYFDEPHKDTLQALWQHTYHPILHDPGEADISAHVDFLSLANIAVEAGLYATPPTTQGEFLHAMGGDVRLKMLSQIATPEQQKELHEGYTRLVDRYAMGELFKVLAVSSQPHIVGWSG